jgi:hypothetical protein
MLVSMVVTQSTIRAVSHTSIDAGSRPSCAGAKSGSDAASTGVVKYPETRFKSETDCSAGTGVVEMSEGDQKQIPPERGMRSRQWSYQAVQAESYTILSMQQTFMSIHAIDQFIQLHWSKHRCYVCLAQVGQLFLL